MENETPMDHSDDEFIDLGKINLGKTIQQVITANKDCSENFQSKVKTILEVCQVNDTHVDHEIEYSLVYKELTSKLNSNDLSQLMSIGILVLASGNTNGVKLDSSKLLQTFSELNTSAVENQVLVDRLALFEQQKVEATAVMASLEEENKEIRAKLAAKDTDIAKLGNFSPNQNPELTPNQKTNSTPKINVQKAQNIQ